jgi:hypothetical protein
MMRTPWVARLSGLTLSVGMPMTLPSTVMTRRSSSLMPPRRTFLNSLRRVFLMMPSVVSMTTNWSSRNSFTATTLRGFSSGWSSTRLAMALPRPETPTSGKDGAGSAQEGQTEAAEGHVGQGDGDVD